MDTKKLKKLWDEHWERKFPHQDRSGNDELEDIHAELVEFDGYIAGIVSSSIADGKKSLPNINKGEDLQQRIDQFIPQNDQEKGEIERYRAYMAKLQEMIEEVEK